MVDISTKKKWQRLFRNRQKQFISAALETERNFEKNFIKRLAKLPDVSRFLAGFVGLLFVLSIALVLQTRALNDKYQTVQAKRGGTYIEGQIGNFTNANPLFAANSADITVSKLIFSSLFKTDKDNKLVGDLARDYTIDSTEKVYTVTLKPNLKWQDGAPLTAKDVVFTYKAIQQPETNSYLFASWDGIAIKALSDSKIQFRLPNSLSSFPYSMTNGIVPEHVLKDVKPVQLRSNAFNNVSPVGSGPFTFRNVEVVGTEPNDKQERIALEANSNYFSGKPNIANFIVQTFNQKEEMIQAYAKNQLNAMADLTSLPDELEDKQSTLEFNIPLTGQVMVFFKTTQDVLKDSAVRKALVLSIDKNQILDKLSRPLSTINEPLLRSQTGYDPAYAQVTNKQDEAIKILDEAGWKLDPATGLRSKDTQKLMFKLYSQNNAEYATVTAELQKQWRDLGVDVQVDLQKEDDLQRTLTLHNYDALLHGISIGADPDVFAYWHGSQADVSSTSRINFSEYSSKKADQSLEAGRTRSDPALRAVKYKPFLEAWRDDAPALALYQPQFLYVAREPFQGLNAKSLNSAADRFFNVQNWTVRKELK